MFGGSFHDDESANERSSLKFVEIDCRGDLGWIVVLGCKARKTCFGSEAKNIYKHENSNKVQIKHLF